jgi:hypothetical protein
MGGSNVSSLIRSQAGGGSSPVQPARVNVELHERTVTLGERVRARGRYRQGVRAGRRFRPREQGAGDAYVREARAFGMSRVGSCRKRP